MRTRFFERRTLPSTSMPTPSAAPTSRRLCWCFLNAMTEVREVTRSVRIFARCAITSSVIPSAKNSFSGSALMFTNGRTATDGTTSPPSAGMALPPENGESASFNPPSSPTRSCVDAYRPSGLFARHRSTIRRSATGAPGAARASGSGSSRITAVIVSGALARAKARLPVSISYTIVPNAN